MQEKFTEILQTPVASEEDPNPEPYETDTLEKAADIAFKIEESMYEKFKLDMVLYSGKARSIIFNLKDKKNPFLRLRVIMGSMSPEFIATAEAKDLASEQKQKEREALH